MNTKVLTTLEYTKIIDLLTEKADSEPGKKLCRDLVPSTDLSAIRTAQRETKDALVRLFRIGSTSFGSNRDLGFSIRSLEIGSSLSMSELLKLASFLDNVSRIKTYGKKEREYLPNDSLDVYFEGLTPMTQLANEINRCILSEEEMADDASPRLKSIRRSKLSTNEKIHSQLTSMVNGAYRTFLQDAVITMRDNRYCIPVKAEYKSQVSGMVHDQSSTGSTFFIEPAAVVNLNNQLKELDLKEQEEIEVILGDLSSQAAVHTSELAADQKIMTTLDFIFAKAKLAMEQNATEPIFNTEHYIQIRKGRHPLLDKKKAVPIDVRLGKDFDLLVITGPNTGGKTVMLKTLGLAQLMAQSGLPILADKGSRVAIFQEIFADIGDEQSIEQSLSTFSSHMTHIVEILDAADSNSLVLVDELGAGTDPQEGASLAMAILEHLRLSQIKTMATTHYPELKAYGIETQHVENASMEFDTATLSPTYRFMQGVPGRSNAFEIARRLGLNEIIVKEAENLTDTDSDVNRIIEQLEAQTVETQKRLEHIKDVEQENLKFNRAVKKLYNEFSHEYDKELEKAQKEIQEMVDTALAESDSILKNLHDKSQLKPHEVIDAKGKLKKLAPQVDLSKNKVLRKAKKEKAARAPRIGDDIIVTAYGQRGTLTSQAKNGNWEAQVGLIKMTLKADEFTLVRAQAEAQQPKKKQINVVKKAKKSSGGPRARLDLRGKRYEEAMQELDAFIDQALLNNMSQVDIIHGIGTGVIRDAVTKYLRRHRHVKSFEYAPQSAGGSGCTIATLG